MNYKQFVLASRPIGLPSANNLKLEEKQLTSIKDGEVLLKPWYISVDPYMRGRMNDVKSYAPSYEVGQPIMGGIVAGVLESKSNLFSEGDLVVGMLPWATLCIAKAENVKKIDPKLAPPSYYLGILGMPGLTAYFGITEIGKPRKGETFVVSGAAGAVGIVAGQIAKMQGCKVIGIAGSDEKCDLIKHQFGFNDAINYNSQKPIKKVLSKVCPEGIDIYFDNVGGEISQGVISNLNSHSRIILCGQISQYNNVRIEMVPDILPRILSRSILVKGFIVRNYSDRFDEGFNFLSQLYKDGSLKSQETIIHGFDKLPEAFLGLFSGNNTGKMLVEQK